MKSFFLFYFAIVNTLDWTGASILEETLKQTCSPQAEFLFLIETLNFHKDHEIVVKDETWQLSLKPA